MQWVFCEEHCNTAYKLAIISSVKLDWRVAVLNKKDAVYCIEIEFGYNYIDAGEN